MRQSNRQEYDHRMSIVQPKPVPVRRPVAAPASSDSFSAPTSSDEWENTPMRKKG